MAGGRLVDKGWDDLALNCFFLKGRSNHGVFLSGQLVGELHRCLCDFFLIL